MQVAQDAFWAESRLALCSGSKLSEVLDDEHPFRVIKQQFGFTKVPYRGLAKNTAQIITLCTLSNLWMARRKLMEIRG